MTFANPWWLAISAGCLLVLWTCFVFLEHRRRTMSTRFTATAMLDRLPSIVSKRRRMVRTILAGTALTCCFAALARPHYGLRWHGSETVGTELLIALDTSASMFARDKYPNRLELSKQAVINLLGNLHGERLGLISFAGTAHLLFPMTNDYQNLIRVVENINAATTPTVGTDIGKAIRVATKTFSRHSAKHPLLIIISDGEDLAAQGAVAAKEAHSQGVSVFTVGVGTDTGELVPAPNGNGFLQDTTGTAVVSKLNRETLRLISNRGGGSYADLGRHGAGLTEVLKNLQRTKTAQSPRLEPIERSDWAVMLAIILLAGEFLFPGQRAGSAVSKKPRWSTPAWIGGNPAISISIAFAILIVGILYATGIDYRKSVSKPSPVEFFRRGTVAYRAKHYEKAIAFFDQSLRSADLNLQERAYYNKGDSLYRLGQSALSNDSADTVRAWQQSLTAFSGALAINPNNEKAKENFAFVERQLKNLDRLSPQHRGTPACGDAPARAHDMTADEARMLIRAMAGKLSLDLPLPQNRGPLQQHGAW